jgi:chromosome segregation ATPase
MKKVFGIIGGALLSLLVISTLLTHIHSPSTVNIKDTSSHYQKSQQPNEINKNSISTTPSPTNQQSTLKQEEAQYQQDKALAQEYQDQANQDTLNAQNAANQQQNNYNQMEQEIQQEEAQYQQYQQQYNTDQQNLSTYSTTNQSQTAILSCLNNIPNYSNFSSLEQQLTSTENSLANLPNAANQESGYSGATAGEITQAYSNQYASLSSAINSLTTELNQIQQGINNCESL